jgi:hypothetical protein
MFWAGISLGDVIAKTQRRRFFNFLMGISNFSLENRGAMKPLMEVENS